jgi:hypothetical protein
MLILFYEQSHSGVHLILAISLNFEAKKKASENLRPFRYKSGDDLLSHIVSNAVSSALEGLTSVFEMGTGVTPPPESPENR